jgi:hypothetical protein
MTHAPAHFLMLLCLFPMAAFGQESGGESQQQPGTEYQIDLAQIEKETEKKPYSLGGFLEFQPAFSVLDEESAFYRLRFPRRNEEGILQQYNSGLRLEGSYQKGAAGFYVTGNGLLKKDYLGWKGNVDLYQGYLSLRVSPNLTLDVGKKVIKWGKGYAWNPVAFVDRPKNPEDPLEALEGFYVLSADFVKSFQGPLKTLAFSPVVLPVTGSVNHEFGESAHVNVGGKLSSLLWDTDLDFLFLAGSSRSTRYGIDLSRNIRSNFEVHGEWAWITDFQRSSPTGSAASAGKSTAHSMLAGARYLTASELTVIAEYYHNGTGFFPDDMDVFYQNVRTPEASSPAGSQLSSFQQTLSGTNFMRDYLYVRASQKEPFGILYLTPEVTSIVGRGDGSFTLIPGITYSPRTNLQLRLRGAFLIGGRGTEYGEKQNDFRMELRMRYFY